MFCWSYRSDLGDDRSSEDRRTQAARLRRASANRGSGRHATTSSLLRRAGLVLLWGESVVTERSASVMIQSFSPLSTLDARCGDAGRDLARESTESSLKGMRSR